MSELTDFQLQQLTGQNECYLHSHASSPASHEQALQLQAAAGVESLTTSTALTAAYDHVMVNSTGGNVDLTLPLAAKGKVYTITKLVAANTVTIYSTAPDTVLGAASTALTAQWSVLRLKAVTGGWIPI